MGAHGGLGGQCKTHRFALTHRLCFRARTWDYINIRPPHNAQFLSTFRSVRLQFVHLHGKPHRFCTSDRPLGITHGRKTVSPSRSPCDSDPFLVAIHNRCSPSWDPYRLFFFGLKLEQNRTWERSLAFFLYLPPSIGLLLTVRSRFFCTRYRV